MSEPIREQLATGRDALWNRDLIAELLTGRGPGWSNEKSYLAVRDARLAADTILARFRVEVLSPVGETEAAKPPLDPEPPTLTKAHCKFCEKDLGDYR